MASLTEQARIYVATNGGHTTVAASIGVTPAHSEEVCSGRRIMSRQFAAGMAPLLGVSTTALLREDADIQLAIRRGALS
jgi:plasmid maintenance system antidote protein VapI